MNNDETKKCIGCINIEECHFPFEDHDSDGDGSGREGYFIDTEGCGLVQDQNNYFLEIFYCPVCGRKL